MATTKKNKNYRPIGVFDSGVGGLSVLLELKRVLPHENFVFLADQMYVPYGEKSKSVLVKRVYKIADYFQKYHNINVLNVGCSHLENLVEQGILNGDYVNNLLLKYLEGIKDSDADCLVLGCTHYPFLKKSIGKILGSRIQIVDSGEAVAKQTRSLLLTNKMKKNPRSRGANLYFTTGDSAQFSKVASKLLKKKVKAKKVKI